MKHLIPVPIENETGFKPSMGKVKALKKQNYFIVKDYAITGDAPKEFIKAYMHGESRKANQKKWNLFIAKTGHKWYPNESITEQLLTRMGECLGVKMAESKIVMAGGQVRFFKQILS